MNLMELLQSYLFTPKGKILAWIIISLMLLLVLKNFVQWIFYLRHPVVTPIHVETPVVSESPIVEDIAKYHLLGASAPAELDATQLPRSILNVSLVGIFSASPMKEAMVAIKLPDGKEKIYLAGEGLPDGVIIYKILPDKVIVKRDEHFEVLLLPEEKLTFEPAEPSSDFERYQEERD